MKQALQPFQLRVLGPPEVYRDGELIALPTKAVAVITILAMEDGSRVPRPKLARWLWPHSDSKNARHSVSQALYVIRNELGTSAIESDPDSVGIGRAVTDVSRFRQALQQEDWEEASRLYKGEFAEGFYVPEAPAFNHWADAQKATLAQQAETLVGNLVAEGLLRSATELAKTLVPARQVNDDIIHVLAQSLREAGFTAELNSLLDVCPPEVGLALEEALTPTALTLEPASSSIRPSPFVGRKGALHWLQERFSEAERGTSNVAILEGEPGIGKTALAKRFEKVVALRGGKVLPAAAYAAEQNVPFGVVSQWIASLSAKDIEGFVDELWFGVIRSVFPIVDDAEGPNTNVRDPIDEWRLLESLRRMLDALAAKRPLLLSVDDINNADPASTGLLHYVLRRSRESRILALGTLRTGVDFRANPVRSWVDSRIFRVQGLSEAEVADWLSEARKTSEAPVPELGTIMERTDGNPLLVSALLEDISNDRLDSDATLPQSVLDFFKPRLEEQTGESRRLLYALAVIGEPAEPLMAAEVAGLDEAAVHAAVEQLVAASLITSGEKLGLRHGLVGDVAASLLSNLERQSLHGRAARVLAKEGQSTDARVAISLDIAGSREDAYEAALRATEACDVLQARTEKEFFLKLALSNAPDRKDAAEVRVRLGELLLQEQRLSEGLEVLQPATNASLPGKVRGRAEAAQLKIVTEMTAETKALSSVWKKARLVERLIGPLEAADTYFHIVSVAHDLGAGDLAVEVSDHIREIVNNLHLDPDTAQRLLRPIGVIGLYKGHQIAADKLKVLPEPTKHDNPAYSGQYYATKAALEVGAGRLKSAEEWFTQSLAIAERYALQGLYYTINNNLGVCLLEQGRYELARHAYANALEHVGEETAPSHHSLARDNLALLYYEMGDHQSAARMASGALAKRGNHQRSYRELMGLYSVLGLSCLQMGDLSRCREVQRELEILVPHHNPLGHDMSYVYIFMARMLDLQKRTEESVASLRDMAHTYSATNELARIRLELERCRLLIKTGVDCSQQLDQILEDLEGSGAVPLIERAESLRTRSGLGRA